MYCCYSSNHLHPIFGVQSQPTCFFKVFSRFFFRFLWPFSRLKSNLEKYYNLGGLANKFNLWYLYVVLLTRNSCLFFSSPPLSPDLCRCVLTTSPTEYKTARSTRGDQIDRLDFWGNRRKERNDCDQCSVRSNEDARLWISSKMKMYGLILCKFLDSEQTRLNTTLS